MPKAYVVSNTSLGIRIDGGLVCAPGDTLTGRVTRKIPLLATDSTIDISLFARTKGRLNVNRQSTNSSYRSGFSLIESNSTRHRIHTGPIHIPTGEPLEEHSWPFSLTIPSRVTNPRRRYPPAMQESSFLPLDPDSMAAMPLPPSFFHEDNGLGGEAEAFVEYVLEAHMVTEGAVSGKLKAVMPLIVRPRTPDPPLVDFRQHVQKRFRFAASPRLLPGREDEGLSLKQKTKMFFNASSIPVLRFDLETYLPGVIQLDNPNPFPLRLRAVPDPYADRAKSSPELLREDAPRPKIKLVEADLTLRTFSDMRWEGLFSHNQDRASSKIHLGVKYALARLGRDVYIPCTSEWPPVDVGEILDLRLSQRNGFCPDFTTLNFRVTHALKWSVKLDIAGEMVQAEGESPVVILPASDDRMMPPPSLQQQQAGGLSEKQQLQLHLQQQESSAGPVAPSQSNGEGPSWMQPPPEEEAPPSFAEVQQEDADAGKGKQKAKETTATNNEEWWEE